MHTSRPRPLSPSRVILARFYKPSLPSSRGTVVGKYFFDIFNHTGYPSLFTVTPSENRGVPYPSSALNIYFFQIHKRLNLNCGKGRISRPHYRISILILIIADIVYICELRQWKTSFTNWYLGVVKILMLESSHLQYFFFILDYNNVGIKLTFNFNPRSLLKAKEMQLFSLIVQLTINSIAD